MLDFEYALFTKEDPIKLLKDAASKLPIHKKFKIAPHIRRASAAVNKCKKFRDIITSEDNLFGIDIGSSFASYFGKKVDKGTFLVVPKSAAKEYIEFLETNFKENAKSNYYGISTDKYIKIITTVIFDNSDYIDAFVIAFLSIRLAQGELDKLKSN
jgi:hypothetical protein